MENEVSYQPSVYFYRYELRNARTKKELEEIGMHLCLELEQLKEWVRDRGMIPPKWYITQREIDQKNWGAVVRFPSSD